MELEPGPAVSQFSYHPGWDRLIQSDASDIIAFWQREKALPEGDDGRGRASQVVFFARDSDGEIAAVARPCPSCRPGSASRFFTTAPMSRRPGAAPGWFTTCCGAASICWSRTPPATTIRASVF